MPFLKDLSNIKKGTLSFSYFSLAKIYGLHVLLRKEMPQTQCIWNGSINQSVSTKHSVTNGNSYNVVNAKSAKLPAVLFFPGKGVTNEFHTTTPLVSLFFCYRFLEGQWITRATGDKGDKVLAGILPRLWVQLLLLAKKPKCHSVVARDGNGKDILNFLYQSMHNA